MMMTGDTGSTDADLIQATLNKKNIRKEVWDQMEIQEALVNYKPMYKKVPNFKGSDICQEKLMELDEMKQATVIYCDTDRSLLSSIFHLAKNAKKVLIPDLRSSRGFLRMLEALDQKDKHQANNIKLQQLYRESTVLGYKKIPHIDVLLLSSVIVSPTGKRMGSDTALSRMIYLVLSAVGAVDESTLIITMVHDLQIIDFLISEQDSALELHVAADIIITPTQLYRTRGMHAHVERQAGQDWSHISLEVMKKHQWLKNVKDSGDATSCADHDDDEHSSDGMKNGEAGSHDKSSAGVTKRQYRRRRTNRRASEGESAVKSKIKSPQNSQTSVESGTSNQQKNGENGALKNDKTEKDVAEPSKSRRSRHGGKEARNRQEARIKNGGASDNKSNDDHTDTGEQVSKGGENRRMRLYGRNIGTKDLPCLYLGGFLRSLRYWEVKRMVGDYGVNPVCMIRKPYARYAFLYFNTIEDLNNAKIALEDLQNVDKMIRVEVGKLHIEDVKIDNNIDETKNANKKEENAILEQNEQEASGKNQDEVMPVVSEQQLQEVKQEE